MIKTTRKDLSSQNEKEVIRLVKEGKTAGHIAGLLNTFKHVVREIAKRNNLTLNMEVADVRDLFGRVKRENRKYKMNGAGFFEDEKILKFIKICKDEQGITFDEIAKTLNRWGKRTISGKKFSTQNVIAKYNMALKRL